MISDGNFHSLYRDRTKIIQRVSISATYLDVLIVDAAFQDVSVHLHHSHLSTVVLDAAVVVQLEDLHVAAIAARTALEEKFNLGR